MKQAGPKIQNKIYLRLKRIDYTHKDVYIYMIEKD
jgi:hypothetical protein